MLPTCRELGIGFVAYSPLGRGFLTGQIKQLRRPRAPTTSAAHSPRFQGDNFQKNLELVEHVERARARRRACTPSQLALAWVLARGDDIVPIPGTKRQRYLEENVKAEQISFSADELARIDQIAPRGVAAGERYPAQVMGSVNR